jgi:hypothetical protein
MRQDAITLSKKMAAALGPSWRWEVWENLDWHASAISACGRWKVYPNFHQGKLVDYSAFLGEPNSPGGIYVERGKTPRAAVTETERVAKAHLEKIGALLKDAP